jgi:soluble lytic murein transglycosylase-like protein
VAGSVGIDPHLAVRVAFHESGLNPNALNPTTGAVGIMQLMPATAATLGVNPHDIMENVRGGVRYLGNQLERFGDPAQALAAYNWGPEHVAQAVLR